MICLNRINSCHIYFSNLFLLTAWLKCLKYGIECKSILSWSDLIGFLHVSMDFFLCVIDSHLLLAWKMSPLLKLDQFHKSFVVQTCLRFPSFVSFWCSHFLQEWRTWKWTWAIRLLGYSVRRRWRRWLKLWSRLVEKPD